MDEALEQIVGKMIDKIGLQTVFTNLFRLAQEVGVPNATLGHFVLRIIETTSEGSGLSPNEVLKLGGSPYTFEELKAEVDLETKRTSQPRPALPSTFPQQTFMEARNLEIAIADGRTGRRWEDITGEIALRHVIPGESIQTKLTAGPALDWWDLPATYEGLREELKTFEIATILLLNIGLGCVLQKPQATATIDELIRLIGWAPRSRTEREEMRRKVYRWMMLFDSITVHGKRPGKYKDPATKKEIDLTSADALIKITGRRYDEQQAKFDGSEVPLEVTWVAGPWLDQHRGNERILQYFGDVRKVAAIPSGKPSGAWAQSIGLALNQLWRERGARADVHYTGEANKLTVAFKPFTRFELLDLFRCEPWVEDILTGNDPKRAQKYWKDAIKILSNYPGKIIGYYKELDPLPSGRKGWQEFWLKYQKLDIRPAAEGTEVIAELSRNAAQARRQASRSKPARKARTRAK